MTTSGENTGHFTRWGLGTATRGSSGGCKASGAVQRPEPLPRRDGPPGRTHGQTEPGRRWLWKARHQRCAGRCGPAGSPWVRHEACGTRLDAGEQRSSEKPDWKQPRARASEASSGVGGSDPGLASSCTPGCVAGQSALTGLGPKPAPPRPPGTTMRLGGLWAGTELGCGSVRPHFWVGAAGRPTVTSLSPLEGQSLLKQIFQNLPRLLQCSPPHVSSLPRPGCEGSVPCSFLFRGLGGGWPHAVPQGVTAKTVPGAGPLFYCQASLYTNLSVKCRWGPGQEVRGPRPRAALV